MDILSFSKITKPIYEGGATIDLRPKGKWLIEIRRTDGTIRHPFGDNWVDNLFINRYANGQLAFATRSPGTVPGNGHSWNAFNAFGQGVYSWVNFFYGKPSDFPLTSTIAVGSGTTPVSVTDTALANQIRFDSVPFATGNSINWSSTSGNIIYTIKESFPVETSTVTYNEAGIRINPSNGANGLAPLTPGLLNRVVFPGPVNLLAGEQLIITVAVTIPTLASSAGKTITIAAQNGVNISGVLKLIATQESMAGGTVTAAGVITENYNFPTLFNDNAGFAIPVALLSTKTAFDTLGVNPTWGTTNQIDGTWAAYTNNSRFRDIGFQWGNGTPAANTNFRSILFRNSTSAGALGGYQLLLDNQMTKASTATLALSLRFTV